MRRLLVLPCVLVALLVVPGTVGAATSGKKSVTKRQLVKAFKQVTKGDVLTRDSRASWQGVDAFRFGGTYPSSSQIGRYGHFVLYVVKPRHQAEVVPDLLDDIHTALPIRPNRKGIRWESNYSARHGQYWTAKKLYGANVVLIWNGTAKKQVDASFRRLATALRKAVARA